jgi:hypothetical protein
VTDAALNTGSTTDALITRAANRVQGHLQGMAPGSTRYHLQDIVSQDHIYASIPWRELGLGEVQRTDLVELLLNRGKQTDWTTPALVIAPQGSGKSTLTYRLAVRLMDDLGQPVFHVDLAHHKGERDTTDFGSAEWIRRILDVSEPDLKEAKAILILDSLDELLSGLPQQRINELLTNELFTYATLIVCRSTYYERYLAASVFAERFSAKFELAGLAPAEQDALASRYLAAAFPSDSDTLTSWVVDWMEVDPTRRSICASPLHLMLAVEAVAPDRNGLAEIDDLVGLWTANVDAVLTREAQRTGTSLDADQKAEALEYVAWHFYDEDGAGNPNPSLFTRDELATLLDRLKLFELPAAVVQEDLENRTLLQRGGSPNGLLVDTTALAFSHRSLHTYFVARHIFRSITGASDRPAEVFGKFLSGPVSQILLQFIDRLRVNSRRATEASERLIAVVRDQSSDEGTEWERARRRISRQQASYYLGALRTSRGRSFLSDVVSTEADLWVARGMAIGLSLSGDESVLMGQIDFRRKERSQGKATPLCDVNIGYHLSFAGDQPLDILVPDVDQGLPTCSLTVRTLIRQLEISSKRGSWRSTLFTLTDLAKHRSVSRQSFAEAVIRDKDRLRNALNTIGSDPQVLDWPEFADAEGVLDELA